MNLFSSPSDPSPNGDEQADPQTPREGPPVMMENISKWYGSVIGLNDVTLRVDPGVVALLGPNGAGKSTLMKILTGQLRPNVGKVRLYGRSVRSVETRRRMGYCPSIDAFYEHMTGREFVETMAQLSGYSKREAQERTEKALDIAGMLESADEGRLKKLADKKLQGCSKGMRQRIKLAQALVHEPDMLVLDEPLSGLDPVGRRDFCQLFRKLSDQGLTLLLSSHVLHEVEQVADRLILLSEGRVIAQGDWASIHHQLGERLEGMIVYCDRPREFAQEMVNDDHVEGVSFLHDGAVKVNVASYNAVATRIGDLVVEKNYRVDQIQPVVPKSEDWFGRLDGAQR